MHDSQQIWPVDKGVYSSLTPDLTSRIVNGSCMHYPLCCISIGIIWLITDRFIHHSHDCEEMKITKSDKSHNSYKIQKIQVGKHVHRTDENKVRRRRKHTLFIGHAPPSNILLRFAKINRINALVLNVMYFHLWKE